MYQYWVKSFLLIVGRATSSASKSRVNFNLKGEPIGAGYTALENESVLNYNKKAPSKVYDFKSSDQDVRLHNFNWLAL